jgi:cytochrome c
MQVLGIAILVLTLSPAHSWAQDVAAGEQVFRRTCLACHDVGPNAKTKLGPTLNGIDGRKAGTLEGYNFSDASKASGIVWNEQTFTPYARAPMQVMPGTKMSFVGLTSDKDIADVWAYLKQFGPDGQKK